MAGSRFSGIGGWLNRASGGLITGDRFNGIHVTPKAHRIERDLGKIATPIERGIEMIQGQRPVVPGPDDVQSPPQRTNSFDRNFNHYKDVGDARNVQRAQNGQLYSQELKPAVADLKDRMNTLFHRAPPQQQQRPVYDPQNPFPQQSQQLQHNYSNIDGEPGLLSDEHGTVWAQSAVNGTPVLVTSVDAKDGNGASGMYMLRNPANGVDVLVRDTEMDKSTLDAGNRAYARSHPAQSNYAPGAVQQQDLTPPPPAPPSAEDYQRMGIKPMSSGPLPEVRHETLTPVSLTTMPTAPAAPKIAPITGVDTGLQSTTKLINQLSAQGYSTALVGQGADAMYVAMKDGKIAGAVIPSGPDREHGTLIDNRKDVEAKLAENHKDIHNVEHVMNNTPGIPKAYVADADAKMTPNLAPVVPSNIV